MFVRTWRPGSPIVILHRLELANPALDALESGPEAADALRRVFTLEPALRAARRTASVHARGNLRIPTARRLRFDREVDRLEAELRDARRAARAAIEKSQHRGVHDLHAYALLLVEDAWDEFDEQPSCEDLIARDLDCPLGPNLAPAIQALEQAAQLANGKRAAELAYLAASFYDDIPDPTAARRNYQRALGGRPEVAAAAHFALGHDAIFDNRVADGIRHFEAARGDPRVGRRAMYELIMARHISGDCARMLTDIAAARPRFEFYDEVVVAQELAVSCVVDHGFPLARARALDPANAAALADAVARFDQDAPTAPLQSFLQAFGRCAARFDILAGVTAREIVVSGRLEAPKLTGSTPTTASCVGRHLRRRGLRGPLRLRLQVRWQP